MFIYLCQVYVTNIQYIFFLNSKQNTVKHRLSALRIFEKKNYLLYILKFKI